MHGSEMTVAVVPLHTPCPSREQFYPRQQAVGSHQSCSTRAALAHTLVHVGRHTQPENVALATKPQSSSSCL